MRVAVTDALLHSQTPAAGVQEATLKIRQTFCIKKQITEPALFIESSKWQIHGWKSSTNARYGLS